MTPERPTDADEPPSPYAVTVANEQTLLDVDEALLQEVVRRALELEKVEAAEIGIAIVDDPAIHELNRRYLDHDCPTDVISFPLHEDEVDPASLPVPRGTGRRIEGEIVASAETAARTAGAFRWRPVDELVLYVVHGLLHVVGYDDLTDAERAVMRSREQAVLRDRGLEPRYDERSDSDGSSPAGRDASSGADS